MRLVRLHGDALKTATKAGVVTAVGEENILPTIRVAGHRYRTRTEPESLASGEDFEEPDD